MTYLKADCIKSFINNNMISGIKLEVVLNLKWNLVADENVDTHEEFAPSLSTCMKRRVCAFPDGLEYEQFDGKVGIPQ